jgi:hypothetical protein
MLLEELGQLKNPVTSSRIEPATFWLVERAMLWYEDCIAVTLITADTVSIYILCILGRHHGNDKPDVCPHL